MDNSHKKQIIKYKISFCFKGLMRSLFVNYLMLLFFGINQNTLIFINLFTPIIVLVYFLLATYKCKKAKKDEVLMEKILNYKSKKRNKHKK